MISDLLYLYGDAWALPYLCCILLSIAAYAAVRIHENHHKKQ